MNINFPNNSLIQNIPQNSSATTASSNANLIQASGQKAIFQFADNRLFHIAQNPMTISNNQQIPQTIYVQMPCNILNQNFLTPNQNASDKIVASLPNTNNAIVHNNLNPNNNNSVILSNALPAVVPTSTAVGNLSDNRSGNVINRVVTDPSNSFNFINQNQMTFINNIYNNMMSIERYQEITETFYNRKLLLKTPISENTVLVEFRLNNQKFQYRMTRAQKADMEALLSSINDQQKQMEILQVYQAEQRKQLQQRPLILNQMINKVPPVINTPSQQQQQQQSTAPLICSSSNATPHSNHMTNTTNSSSTATSSTNATPLKSNVFPINPVLVTLPQNHQNVPSQQQQRQYTIQPQQSPQHAPTDNRSTQNFSNHITNKNILFNTSISSNHPNNGIVLSTPPISSSPSITNHRQSSIITSSPIIKKETSTPNIQKRPIFRPPHPYRHESPTISNCSVSQSPLTTTTNIKTPSSSSAPTSNINQNNDKPPRLRRYNNMKKVLLEDYTSVLQPDYKTPFVDEEDIVKRLMPYHVLEEFKDTNHSEVDNILSDSFNYLKQRCANMKKMVSTICVNSKLNERNEKLIIKRMRLDLEKDILENEKLSQTHCYGNQSIIPLLFDKYGNAYPSIKDESKIKTESDVSVKIEADNVGNRRKRKQDDGNDDDFDDSDDSVQIIENPIDYFDEERSSSRSSSDHTVPVVDEDDLDDNDDDDDDVDDDCVNKLSNCIDGSRPSNFTNGKINDRDKLISIQKPSHSNHSDLSPYNIQDISLDSFDSTSMLYDSNWAPDSNNDSSTINRTPPPSSSVSNYYDRNNTPIINNESNQHKTIENTNHLQSEDPDVDAAIKSILF